MPSEYYIIVRPMKPYLIAGQVTYNGSSNQRRDCERLAQEIVTHLHDLQPEVTVHHEEADDAK